MDLSLGLGLIIINDWFLLFIGLIVAGYYYSTWHFDYFTKKDIPGPKPYPIVGTAYKLFTRGVNDTILEEYRKYGKVHGTFLGRTPMLNVADEEMMREIFVKQFHAFTNRRQNRSVPHEIMDKLLTRLMDADWKRVRNLLTPTFSSGKLKLMSHRINHCAKILASNIAEKASKGEQFEARELTGAFAMDVIASTGFALEIDSQKDPNNQFVLMAKKLMDPNLFNPLIIITLFFPFLLPLVSKLGFSLIPKDTLDFFLNVLEQIMQGRQQEGDKTQKDFMQLMMNAHKQELDHKDVAAEVAQEGATFDASQLKNEKGLSKSEILAQGFLFFLAGFDTTAATMALLFHNLTVNPECQEKLFKELCDTMGDSDDIDYEKISQMPYLEMCLLESLRMYPLAGVLSRFCGQDVTIKGIDIPKGTLVNISVLGIHRDPEIYPEPDNFIPERFSAEEKAKRSPYHFLPFGYGPRNCIGMRLALAEAKMGTAHIIRKLKLIPSEKTENPIKFKKIGFRAQNGIWIKAEKRE